MTKELKEVIHQIEGVLNEKGRNHFLVYMSREQAEAVRIALQEELKILVIMERRGFKHYKDGEI